MPDEDVIAQIRQRLEAWRRQYGTGAVHVGAGSIVEDYLIDVPVLLDISDAAQKVYDAFCVHAYEGTDPTASLDILETALTSLRWPERPGEMS